MSSLQWQTQVVPAQLSFLAIYNPSLGPTDETFRDQLVFYYSRTPPERKASKRQFTREAEAEAEDNAARQEEDERLRQIGFAQGMVDFARNFSSGDPISSVDTEKSRIVLQELEKGWWILASIHLTQFPDSSDRATFQKSKSKSKSKDRQESKSTTAYSSREVSPPALLVAQLQQAHHIFCLHHGPSLDDLFGRFARDKFCNTLERYWNRFARTWDVLLHGNPAVDVFSAVKLASGGELGFGVGEEEWGSGEREVLEDLAGRTEGLLDLVICRFGEASPPADGARDLASDVVEPPWMGNRQHPHGADGVIFSGVGAISRQSLRNVSLWMRHVFMYGDRSYGVTDNPIRDRRKRRRRNLPQSMHEDDTLAQGESISAEESEPEHPQQRSQRYQTIDGTKSGQQQETEGPQRHLEYSAEDNQGRIKSGVAAQKDSPTAEAQGAASRNSSDEHLTATAQSIQDKSRTHGDAVQQSTEASSVRPGTTMGIPDSYMKYLTFGLSTLGRQSEEQPTQSNESTRVHSHSKPRSKRYPDEPNKPLETHGAMTELDPIPDGEAVHSKSALRRTQEENGYFLIGLKGDLTALPEGQNSDLTDGSAWNKLDGSRTVLRTVHIEMAQGTDYEQNQHIDLSTASESSDIRRSRSTQIFRRLRVLLYVRRPFMYCFLFKDRTPSLQLMEFYASIHRNLLPIHKPLLSSTNFAKIASRIEASHGLLTEEQMSSTTETTNKLPPKQGNPSPIFDLIYDPRLLTLHASIPNIPEPGTLDAEGLSSRTDPSGDKSHVWSRVDALNVHSQVLDTLASVDGGKAEIERTSKTSRGWWVVWMKVQPSSPSNSIDASTNEGDGNDCAPISATDLRIYQQDQSSDQGAMPHHIDDQDMHRTAFLVRRATDPPGTSKSPSSGSRAVSGMFSTMTLGLSGRSEEDKTGGASAGWGPGALAGGIGVDARKYVEGILSLNR